jgi:PAS domain S-box-containing protein
MIRIILIELDPNSAQEIQNRLHRVSYDVVATTATIDDVVTRANDLKPDLILMDVRMKGEKGGIEAARAIRKLHNVPIIFVAADADVATVRKAIAAEPDGFLINPLDERELIAAVDIAIHKHAKEQNALASERRIRELTDALPEVVYETNAQGAFTFANAGCLAMFGYTKQELLAGMTLFDLFVPEERDRSRGVFRRRMEFQELGWVPYTGLHKDGSTFPVSVRAVPIRLDGAIVGMRGIIVDVTEKKRAEDMLQQAHSELEQRVKERTADLARAAAQLEDEVAEHKQAEEAAKGYAERLERLTEHLEELVEERTARLRDAERLAGIGETAAMIGHDLRNPLQGLQYIVDLQQLLFERLPLETRRSEHWKHEKELIDRISERVFYMDKIVGDLQDFARPIAPDHEALAVLQLINDVLKSIPQVHGIRVITNIPDLQMIADPHLMHRVFGNLILNAIQAMPDGGTLTVNASAEDGSVAIRVSDTGVGIPAELKGKLFKPLFTGKAKGTGLGLAVVKRIVDAHSGTITFESVEGKGTTFTVRLPSNSPA